METHKCKINVRYAETDQMGVVHHSVYAVYYEQARVQLLADQGIDMAQMEIDANIVLPVRNINLEYISPAYFGDVLEVHSRIKHLSKVKLVVECWIQNQEGTTINQATIKLGVTDKDSGKIVRIPDKYFEPLNNTLQ